MLIPDDIRKCVVFIGLKLNNGTYSERGTGFFLSRNSGNTSQEFLYLITAKHVIDKIKKTGLKTVCIRVKLSTGLSQWVETPLDQWLYHPTDKTVDVALLRIEPSGNKYFDHRHYPLESCISPEQLISAGIGLGNELSITGLFSKHYGKENLIPIIRVGNIAAMPEERISTEFGEIEGYLIETRSIGGLSGSPIFVSREFRTRMQIAFVEAFGEVEESKQTNVSGYYLLGLIQSHFETVNRYPSQSDDEEMIEERNNTGIAVAVPASKILEVINQPIVKDKEQEIENEERRKKNG